MPSGLTDWMSCSGGSSILCINIYIHVYLSVYLYLYIYIHIHIHMYINVILWLASLWQSSRKSENSSGRKLSEAAVSQDKKTLQREKNEDIKCSASECLSVYSVLRLFLLEAMQTQNLRAIRAECESYFRLCHVLDLLQQVKLGKTTPRALEVAVVAHLSAFKDAYQDTRFLPKHHYSLHLCRMLHRHGTLVSCWCHERKHKEIKRHAQLICNTWSAWERSVMVDAACDMLDSLMEDQDQSFYGGICQPQEAPMATKQLLY